MAKEPLKWIGIVFYLLTAGFIFYVAKFKLWFNDGCSGLLALFPICWIFQGLQFIMYIVVGILLFSAIIWYLLEEQQRKWFLLASVFTIFAIITILVPDFIPFIDEIVTSMIALYAGYKTITVK